MKNLTRHLTALPVLLWALCCAPSLLPAQTPGSPDPGFGAAGIAQEPIGWLDELFYNMAVQPDGKIVAVGADHTGQNGLGGSGFVVRVLSNGALDTGFGHQGIVVFPRSSELFDVALQPDGKIVAVGYLDGDAFVARLNPDGTPDHTFGTAGQLSFNVGGNFQYFNSVTLAASGEIVAAGVKIDGDYDWLIMRLLPDGSADPSFGINGAVVHKFPPDLETPFLRDMELLPDGRVLCAGHIPYNGQRRAAVLRFEANGDFDTSYGNAGIALPDISNTFSAAYAMALQPDGKLLLGGYTGKNFVYTFLLARLLPDGQPDIGFGTNGFTSNTLGNNGEIVEDLQMLPDGSIVGVGTTNGFKGMLLHWSPDGAPDASFGSNGIQSLDGQAVGGGLYGIAVQPDGKWLGAGYLRKPEDDMAICRYLPNGLPDTTFGGKANALVTFNLSSAPDYPVNAVPLPNGDVLLVASTFGDEGDMAVLKLKSDGTRAPDFGIGGVASGVFNIPGRREVPRSVLLQADGKLVVAGNVQDSMLIWRIKSDGTPDLSFGKYGVFSPQKDKDEIFVAFDLEPLADGSILYAGYIDEQLSDNGYAALGRVLPDGTADFSWGILGMASWRDANRIIRDVEFFPDGKIAVAGYSYDSALKSKFFLARLDENGDFDPAFGSTGIVNGNWSGSHERAYDVHPLPDGSMLAAVAVFPVAGHASSMAVLRYLPDGSPDLSFGDMGRAVVSTGDSVNIGLFGLKQTAMAVQPDGKIILAGTHWFNASSNLLVCRFLPNGQPDLSWGNAGCTETDVAGQKDISSDILIQSDGKILLNGLADNGHDYDILLVRYLTGLSVSASDFAPAPGGLLVYPNPLRDRAMLRYNNPAAGPVTVELTDLQGKLIQTFVAEQQTAGEQELELRFQPGLVPGAYICRISTGKGVAAARIEKAGQ